MGIPWQESGAVEGGVRAWLFGDVSDCGLWSLKNLLSWWREADYHKANGGCPFNVVKATLGSDKGLREAFRTHKGFRQERRGLSNIIIPCDAAPPDGTHVTHATTDTAFAAAASGVGFPVYDSPPSGRLRTMQIGAKSETRNYTFEMIEVAWRQKSFEQDNPQHPFAYAKAAAITYMSAVAAIKKDKPLVRWSPPGAVGEAYIHPNCSSKTEEKIANLLKGQ